MNIKLQMYTYTVVGMWINKVSLISLYTGAASLVLHKGIYVPRHIQDFMLNNSVMDI